MRLEAQKFAVYLLIPITASLAFNEPSVQKWSADYFQFMKYPSNPKTNLMEEYESLKKQRDEEIEWEKRMEEKRAKGREEYLRQLKQLSVAKPDSSGGDSNVVDDSELRQGRGLFGWLRRRGRGNATDNSTSLDR